MNCRLCHMIDWAEWTAVLQHRGDPTNLMRLLSAITFLTLFAAGYAADAAPLPSPHQVDIPLSNGILHAQLYKPDGGGPFPIVIGRRGLAWFCPHSAPIHSRYTARD